MESKSQPDTQKESQILVSISVSELKKLADELERANCENKLLKEQNAWLVSEIKKLNEKRK